MGSWQPIETAPRDGTIVWCFERKLLRGQFMCRLAKTTKGDRWHNLSANVWAEPTHWQLLPEPPALPTKGEK